MKNQTLSMPQRVVIAAIGLGAVVAMVLPSCDKNPAYPNPGASSNVPSIAPAKENVHLPAYYLQQLALPGVEKEKRVLLIEALAAVDPAKAAPFLDEAKATRLKMNLAQAAADKRQQKINREVDAREAKRRKREGVSIGMTEQDVLASSWGRPERKRGLTRADMDVESWHYPSGSVLYFNKGVLVQILR